MCSGPSSKKDVFCAGYVGCCWRMAAVDRCSSGQCGWVLHGPGVAGELGSPGPARTLPMTLSIPAAYRTCRYNLQDWLDQDGLTRQPCIYVCVARPEPTSEVGACLAGELPWCLAAQQHFTLKPASFESRLHSHILCMTSPIRHSKDGFHSMLDNGRGPHRPVPCLN